MRRRSVLSAWAGGLLTLLGRGTSEGSPLQARRISGTTFDWSNQGLTRLGGVQVFAFRGNQQVAATRSGQNGDFSIDIMGNAPVYLIFRQGGSRGCLLHAATSSGVRLEITLLRQGLDDNTKQMIVDQLDL